MIRRGYADWSGGQIHYRHAGSGEAILLLGGAPRTGSQFDPVIARLAAAGFTAIAPDMPGFGLSDALPADADMAQIAAFVPALLDAMRIERAHLFGLHSGGKVVAAAAAGWRGRTASLIVAGKSHSIGADQERRNQTVRAVVEHRYFANGADCVDGPDAMRGWAAEARYLAEMWWEDGLLHSADPASTMRAIEMRVIDHLQARRSVRHFYAANFNYDLTADLRRCGVPLRVIEITSEAEDAAIGRQARALIAGIDEADVVELPQVDGPGYVFHAGIDAITNAIAEFAQAHPIGDPSNA